MQSAFLRKVVGMIVGLALLSACAGNGGGVPPRDGVPQAGGWSGDSEAAALNLSGQYKGTVSTSQVQNVKSTLDVGQYRTAIGGRLTLHFGRPPIVDDAVWTLNGSKLAGTIVTTGGACIFATTATYDSTKHVLNGKFSPVHGCSASTNGTYLLKHQCIYKPAGPADVRPDAGGLKMC